MFHKVVKKKWHTSFETRGTFDRKGRTVISEILHLV